jgi:NitT/TauT family transport system ATP-binding protein
MTAPLVELSEVTKQFSDGPRVLDKISLAVEEQEFVTLIGPSGCGKSTLLRLIAGLISPSSGRLAIQGQPPEHNAADLSFVFQAPTLLPWLTTAENVELPQKLRRVPSDERTTTRQNVLELVGLESKSNAYPRQLSGGQQMRVSLARALSMKPKLLLLDEPFGALDEMSRERLNEELLAIKEQQAWTAVFVTHSVAEAVFLSDRIIVLSSHPGRVHADLRIELPRRRTTDTRLSAAYHQQVVEVSRVLRSVQK